MGKDAFFKGQHHAGEAARALDAGDIEMAKVHARIADAQSRLALAAAVVLTTDSDQVGSCRMTAGGLGF